jgi:glycosyltransferase involved in cell wall biosynthesis
MEKKILFIITKSEMGGAQRFLYEFARQLDNKKNRILVAGGTSPLEKNGLLKKLNEKNIKTVPVKNFSNTFNVKNFLAFFELTGIIVKFKPDVLYLLSSEAGFTGSIVGKLYKLIFRRKMKIIYRIGGWAFKEPKSFLIKKAYLWLEKISSYFKDVIIVNSEFDRLLAIKNKIAKPKKIITIYNGLDTDSLKFLSPEEAREFIGFKNTDSILIGVVANLYKNKGLEYLIVATNKIKSNQKINFVIIGDGPERNKLEKLIKKYNLENKVHLIGYIPDASKYLKAFDLLVLPSVKEGQPWAILEAMATEVPIVATNIAGIPEMIENEKSGLLVEPADPEALAEAIEKMLSRPSLAKECSDNALITLREKFNAETMIRKNEKLF